MDAIIGFFAFMFVFVAIPYACLNVLSIIFSGGMGDDEKTKLKKRLKYFNPTIKRNILGNQYVEWTGRDKPLSDSEVDALFEKP